MSGLTAPRGREDVNSLVMRNEISPSAEQERDELARVSSSNFFARAPGLVRLLNYLCEKCFKGESGELKEYTIAVEFMGLKPAFAEEKNSQVRVEIHRLRRKLKEYYELDGAHNPLRIVLLPGQYTPVFEVPAEGRSAAGEHLTLTVDAAMGPLAATIGPPRRWVNRFRDPTLIGAAIGVILISSVLWFTHQKRTLVVPKTSASVAAGGAATPLSTGSVHILAGLENTYVDAMGNTWLGDRYFTGGATMPAPQGLRPFIRRAPDPGLLQSCRTGDFSYAIPIKPGVYELRLYFVETIFGESTQGGGGQGSRTFQIDMNGKRLLTDFDIIGDAGQEFTADVRVFKDVVPGQDGYLRLDFKSYRSPAVLSAIEIIPSTPHRLLPVRIVTQDHNYTDPASQLWGRDRFYSGGTQAINDRIVANTTAPGLFTSERWGNFSYTIPVDRGTYTAKLYFAETYYGQGNPGGGGPGKRTFDVYCNGVALLRGFDMLADAGPNRAIVKVFRGLKPTSTGKLVFTFMPGSHWALVNAIEVLDED